MIGKRFFRRFGIALVTALIFLVVGIVGWRWLETPGNYLFSTAKKPVVEKVFTVGKGEKLNKIASRLYEEGYVRSPFMFQVIVFLKGFSKKIQAGSYQLKPDLTLEEIGLILTHGTNDIWVTFPEGWRREEFAQRLAANLDNFDPQLFISLTKEIEGTLFPDKYLFSKATATKTVVDILVNNFAKRTKGIQIDREKLVLASIVEREANTEEDRPIIAGILIKRWQNGWPLQADATVQYALASIQCEKTPGCDWWPQVKEGDTQINSLSNTYKYKGIPPTPICNPGMSSINAVTHPKGTEYWYYLTDKDGKTYYGKTYQEHITNILRYLKSNR